MRISFYSIASAALLLLALHFAALAKPPSKEVIKLLPRDVGDFRQVGPVRQSETLSKEGLLAPQAAGQNLEEGRHFVGAEADYASSDHSRLLVEIVRFDRDSDAYSLLTIAAKGAREGAQSDLARISKEIGTASIILPGRVAFFKGTTFVRVSAGGGPTQDQSKIVTLARLFSDSIEKGEGDIPVLVKHLPQWEQVQGRVVYLAGFHSLTVLLPNQPILDTISSEGDADAAATNYGSSQFIIVEFNTPQLAGDNDRSIIAKIEELRAQDHPVPTAYRRVGNYSVFVFNAANEQAANELIDQVQYEQLVQWLGDNPYMLEKAQREYYETTAGVLVAVVKASGLSLLACLTAGGFIGALLFSWRRAQQRDAEAFSDAGGMLRLNIDEITPQTDRARLLGSGNET